MKSIRKMMVKDLIRILLRLHNWTYQKVGQLSQQLEADGLHPKHRLMKYHQWFVDQVKPGWSVLDVGCGNGALASDLAKKCREVVGIDISKSNIDKAKIRAKNVRLIHGDATTYHFEDRIKFDAIILSNVLEHIEDRVGFLKKLSRLSDLMLIRVPMLERDWITLYKRELGVEFRLDSTHFTEHTLEQLKQELLAANLSIMDQRICFGEIYILVKSVKL